MHATCPAAIQHHPGWFGALIGALAGAVLMLGLLLLLDRVDLRIAQPAAPAAVENTRTEMARTHRVRERQAVIASDRAAKMQRSFVVEHRIDLAAPVPGTWADHFSREHEADLRS
jgi:hypothetical protein